MFFVSLIYLTFNCGANIFCSLVDPNIYSLLTNKCAILANKDNCLLFNNRWEKSLLYQRSVSIQHAAVAGHVFCAVISPCVSAGSKNK